VSAHFVPTSHILAYYFTSMSNAHDIIRQGFIPATDFGTAGRPTVGANGPGGILVSLRGPSHVKAKDPALALMGSHAESREAVRAPVESVARARRSSESTHACVSLLTAAPPKRIVGICVSLCCAHGRAVTTSCASSVCPNRVRCAPCGCVCARFARCSASAFPGPCSTPSTPPPTPWAAPCSRTLAPQRAWRGEARWLPPP
jgi:hypothetical protein